MDTEASTAVGTDLIRGLIEGGGVVAGLTLMAIFVWLGWKYIFLPTQKRTDKIVENSQDHVSDMFNKLVDELKFLNTNVQELKNELSVSNANYVNLKDQLVLLQQKLDKTYDMLNNKVDKSELEGIKDKITELTQQLTTLKLKIEIEKNQ